MAGLRQRLSSRGISLDQFVFQFVVVLLGVYLAIFLEGNAADRSKEADARAMLESLLEEIEMDEREVTGIDEIQEDRERGYEALADLLATATQVEEPRMDSLFRGVLSGNPTVYPRRAAYSALLASGGLAFISGEEIPILLANLYEHEYPRLIYLGEMYDKAYAENFVFEVNTQYWDDSGGQLFHRGKDANRVFRNLALNQVVMAEMYRARLSATLAAQQTVKEAVESYLLR